jgi:hypothetical protein
MHIGIDERIIFERIIEKDLVTVWAMLIWLRIWSSGKTLWVLH